MPATQDIDGCGRLLPSIVRLNSESDIDEYYDQYCLSISLKSTPKKFTMFECLRMLSILISLMKDCKTALLLTPPPIILLWISLATHVPSYTAPYTYQRNLDLFHSELYKYS